MCNFTEQLFRIILHESKINKNKQSIHWETIYRCYAKNIFDRKSLFGILNGNLGIILFLITYYKHSIDKKEVKELIDKGLKECIHHYKKKDCKIGFYNGIGGLIYVLLEAFKLLSEQQYLDEACKLTYKKTNKFDCKKVNLEEGLAGYLLSLLHLYDIDTSEYLKQEIFECLNVIIGKARFTKKGVFWDEDVNSYAPVMGFLKGNSGIVFTLLEVQKQFVIEDKLYKKIISEAFTFENTYFAPEERGWINTLNFDYYFGNIYKTDKLFKPKNEFSFKKGINSPFWDTGDIGFLLSRSKDSKEYKLVIETLNALVNDLIQEKNRFPQIELNKTGGLILSLHGIGELNVNYNLELIIKAILKSDKESSHYLNEHISDLSFLKGKVGKGYLLLKLKEKNMSSVLTPFVCKRKEQKEFLDLDVWDVILKFQLNYFSLNFKINKPKTELFYDLFNVFFKQEFIDNQFLQSSLIEEKIKFKLRSRIGNWLYEKAKQIKNCKQNHILKYDEILKNRSNMFTFFDIIKNRFFILFLHPEDGILRIEVSSIDFVVFNELRNNSISYQKLLEVMLQSNNSIHKMNKESLENRIQELFMNGFIEKIN
ncbi:lanthionine synthetase LanC family protein [Flammeovirga kamogawensis]|uniref:Lanthionine synthetase C-like protein n=1 Tax=Flammeovirga kamogawensis TaxID=373891 RepID=A0ABX8H0D4_9BACT|nr:lanthionine synthetase LanC family protein [Flammeovirga kamogawensis]MBB6463672.1 hypothetical protein [Flammeovirga kamogawensis]QWG09285.1 hypothetical protein KM029_22020 [Flammeovirga kamogawensis]TRX64809.1 hypothetical protein EO216_19935 [Flammeovirga kamogawensis]